MCDIKLFHFETFLFQMFQGPFFWAVIRVIYIGIKYCAFCTQFCVFWVA